MKHQTMAGLGVVLAAILLVIGLTRGATRPDPLDAADPMALAENGAVPVLVELFTSEGCSSCPPADELLMRLVQTQPIPGVQIIALSEHVDYWNRLGWKDPYSSAAFTERQNGYARVFGDDDIYTPQMVVDGGVAFVGGSESKAREAIAAASRLPKAGIEIKTGDRQDGSAPPLVIRVASSGDFKPGAEAEVLLALIEDGLRSDVSRGENAGRKLVHTAVVRRLTTLGSVKLSRGNVFTAEPGFSKDWKKDRLRAVVFVQDRASRRVLGAAAIPIGEYLRNQN
jgi:hypothetical protein